MNQREDNLLFRCKTDVIWITLKGTSSAGAHKKANILYRPLRIYLDGHADKLQKAWFRDFANEPVPLT
jgi:hypothetical protein